MDSFLTFRHFSDINKARCERWHPAGIQSWSPSDWITAVAGEFGELASLIKMRNRERDGLVGNKFHPTDEMIGKEIADVVIYMDLFAQSMGIDLSTVLRKKFNEVSERNNFPERL